MRSDPAFDQRERLLGCISIHENFSVNRYGAPFSGSGRLEFPERRKRLFGAPGPIAQESQQGLCVSGFRVLAGHEIPERNGFPELSGLQERADETGLGFERFSLLGQRFVDRRRASGIATSHRLRGRFE